MKASRKNSTLQRCVLETLESRQLMAAGDLDSTFSLDGKATFRFDGASAFAQDAAVQADGKTVVVGYTIVNGSGLTRFALARFNVDGTPDTTFGTDQNGKVVTQIHSSLDMASAVAIQPDGKIVVVGSAHGFGGSFSSGFAVARYMPNGSLDRSFDGDGKLVFKVKSSSTAEDVVLQRDGKIVIAGYDLNGGGIISSSDYDFAVARLNPNGSLDTSFASTGKRIIGMGEEEFARAVAIDYSGTAASNPNFGKIILAGELQGSGRVEYAMARLNTNGALDNTFDGNGQLAGKFHGYSKSFVRGLTIQPSGKYVIAGHAINGTNTADTPIALARYNANGSIDTSFGRRGSATIEFGGNDKGDDVIQTADGSLVVAGTTNGKFALAKFSANGSRIDSFGTNGKVITDFAPDGTASNVRLAKSAGTQLVVTGGSFFKTARYRENGGTLITITSDDAQATEGTNNNATFTVTRSEALPVATRVFLNIGGNAHRPNTFASVTDPIDYSLTGMSVPFGLGLPFVDIPANTKEVTVTLRPVNDTIREGTEFASFTIAPNAAYDIGASTGVTLSIADKDHVIFIATPTRPPLLTASSTLRSSAVSQPARTPGRFSDIRVDELI